LATESIEQVVGKKAIKYKARVRLTHKGKKLFEQSKTFTTEAQAKNWAKKLAVKLDLEGVPKTKPEKKSMLIGDLITRYLDDDQISERIGRTKAATLRALRAYDIALIHADELTAHDLVEHCRQRLDEPHSPKPQTIYHDITYLYSVLKVAEIMFQCKANTYAHQQAIPTLIELGLIGRSERRVRRPTPQELEVMEVGLRKRQSHRGSNIPLVDIYYISILTCMRISEITRITWKDLDEKNSTLTIRDRKDPRNKRGNDCEIPLFQEALSIIKKQNRDAAVGRILPYKSQSIGSAWQRVCFENGIEDLHYHDLRAEGACRLIESGMSIVEVSKITGHKDINVLNNVYLRLSVKKLHAA